MARARALRQGHGQGQQQQEGQVELALEDARRGTAGTTSRASAQTWLRASRVRRAGRMPARSASATGTVRRSARSRTRFGGPSCWRSGRRGRLTSLPERQGGQHRGGVARAWESAGAGGEVFPAEGLLEPSGRGSRRRGNIVGGVSRPTLLPLCALVCGHSSLWRGRGRGRRGVEAWTASRAHLLGQRQGRRGLSTRRAGRVASCLGQRAQGGWCTRWLTTFSSLRFREQPGMPGPVRDLEHMRGLPSNTPAHQKEAYVGWLLAARSATFMDAVRTLENPLPSGPPYPSAFFVDEVAAFLQDEESKAAEFNSCIYGMPNWKPARWARALRGLATSLGGPSAKSQTSSSSARRRRRRPRDTLQHCAVQEGPEGGEERQVHGGHAWASKGGQVDPTPAARRLGGGSRVPVLCWRWRSISARRTSRVRRRSWS